MKLLTRIFIEFGKYYFLLIVFSLSVLAQDLKSPYPIIFVHGLSDNDKSWVKTKEALDDNQIYTIYDANDEEFPNEGIVFHACLNKDFKSNDYTEDVYYEFRENDYLQKSDVYFVNFDAFLDEKQDEIIYPSEKITTVAWFKLIRESLSNESAIYKQGYVLGKVIQEVLKLTEAEKVILVGHSMGGLAIREYLQRIKNGEYIWWVDIADQDNGHKVAKVATIGTPHLGSNFGSILKNWLIFDRVFKDLHSEAVRDLRYEYNSDPGIYLFGGYESNHKRGFHNWDINCDGNQNNLIAGISKDNTFNDDLPLPTNIDYEYIVSKIPISYIWGVIDNYGDRVVKDERQWLYKYVNNENVATPLNVADTIQTHCYHSAWLAKRFGGSEYPTPEIEDYFSIIRGLDEPDIPKLAYQVNVNHEYTGLATIQTGFKDDPDYDWYFFELKNDAYISIRVDVTNNYADRIDFYNNLPSENAPNGVSSIYEEFDGREYIIFKPNYLLYADKKYYFRIKHNIEITEETLEEIWTEYTKCIYTFSVNILQENELATNFQASATTGIAPLAVSFSDISTHGIDDVDTWEWNFGDGNSSTFNEPSHTYTQPGYYTVSFTANSGTMSDTKTKTNYIAVNPPSTSDIVAVEYFFDDDPGFGSGTSISVSQSNFLNIETTISLSNVSLGLHRLYFRVMDADEQWSMAHSIPVLVENTETEAPNLSELEYFVDDDPGFNNGESYSISDTKEIETEWDLDLSNVNPGLHRIYFRAKDANRNWSMAHSIPVLVQENSINATPPAIATIEYFINDAPSYIKKKDDKVQSINDSTITFIMSGDTAIFEDRIPLNDYDYGEYTISVRAQDENGLWGIPQYAEFENIDSVFPIELISPIDLDTVSTQEIEFKWTNTGAVKYELLVDNNSGFGSPEISKYNIDTLRNYTGQSIQFGGNWLEQNIYYWKIYAHYNDGTLLETSTATFTYLPEKQNNPDWVPIYRAYNPSAIDHFYCTNDNHLQTAIDGNYNFEKVEGYLSILPFETNNIKSIFRFYLSNDGCHYYTASPSKRDSIIIADTLNIYEGISGYTYAEDGDIPIGLTKMHYLFLENTQDHEKRDHFYTTSDVEKENAILRGYQDKGVLAYVSANGHTEIDYYSGYLKLIGNGINSQNGNYSYSNTSFFIPGGSFSLDFSHQYQSYLTQLFRTQMPLGAGWSHTYNSYLFKTDSLIYVFWANGNIHIYNRNESGYKTTGVYDDLSEISDTTIEITNKEQIKYTFESLMQDAQTLFLTSMKDNNDNVLTLNYDIDEAIQLSNVESPEGRKLEFSYFQDSTKRHLIMEIVDPIDRKIQFEYDSNGNLSKFINANADTTNYKYDEANPYDHLLTEILMPEGNIIKNEYSEKKIYSQTFGSVSDTNMITMGYNSNTYSYIVDEASNEYEYYYLGGIGNVNKIITPSKEMEFKWDDDNNPTLPTEVIDGMGYKTQFTYDEKGNTLSFVKPHGYGWKYSFNSLNKITEYSNPKNITTYFDYDTKGNLTEIETQRGTTTISYSSNGTIRSVVDPLDRLTSFSYNSYGNPVAVINNVADTLKYEYDGASRITKKIDAQGNITQLTYDENDNVTSVTDANNNEVKYEFDKNDKLISVEDANGNKTSFKYNAEEKLTEIINPKQEKKIIFYDPISRPITKTQPNGTEIDFQYESLGIEDIGNVDIVKPPIGSERYFIYSKNNDILGTSDTLNLISFVEYDSLNRITSYFDKDENEVSYTYDLNGNILSITYPGDKTVTYEYYDDDLLQSVKDWNNNETSYYYLDDGSLDSALNANGSTIKYLYDSTGRMLGLINRKSDETKINSCIYSLDKAGNYISVEKSEPFSSLNKDYNNILSSFDSANRIDSAGSLELNFNTNGNMTEKNNSGTISRYSYDIDNQLVQYIAGDTINYSYDYFGNRLSNNNGDNEKKYILDINNPMSNVLMETDSTGQVICYYIYGNGLVSRIMADGKTSYYHYDTRGNVIAMTDSSESLTHKYSYDEFGRISQINEADYNPFRFVGKFGVMFENDDLYFMRARYYDPEIRKFIQEDPVWNVNLYTYANNNPLLNIDPTGKFAFLAVAGAVLSAKTIISIAQGVGEGYYLNKELQYYEDLEERNLEALKILEDKGISFDTPSYDRIYDSYLWSIKQQKVAGHELGGVILKNLWSLQFKK
ncbi:RHS repeat-associated core domain-containing protein [Bacteroidota bacterium]